ncbi:MAG: adenylosuccinate lyase, partial [Clostridiaceae bacterium]|nr:adenylosuccinate lyase [Clostridiaceae bacterium]
MEYVSKPNYENPLVTRYAGKEMLELFSPDRKFVTWRKLWIALAEAEQKLGLPIGNNQIEEMKAHLYDIDYEAVAAQERLVRHDVMAHV